MPKTAPRRTRRVNNPFDARLEVRLYSTELAALRENAAARGMSASDLTRQQLGDLIAAAPPKPNPTPPTEPEAVPEPSTDLASVIAERLGCTPGQALLKLHLGKVEVGGERWAENLIPEALIESVTVEGEVLPDKVADTEPSKPQGGRRVRVERVYETMARNDATKARSLSVHAPDGHQHHGAEDGADNGQSREDE